MILEKYGFVSLFNKDTKHFDFSLYISALPVIAVEKQLIEIPTNCQSIKLSCYISSRYKPTSIKWFKDSGEVSDNRKKYESKGNNLNILTIHDFNGNDSGIYKCRVDNEKGYNESEEIAVEYCK